MVGALVRLKGIKRYSMVTRSVECHLPLIPFLDPNKMITITKVKFGEGLSPLQKLEHRRDDR